MKTIKDEAWFRLVSYVKIQDRQGVYKDEPVVHAHDVYQLIAEAERRGREAAWEEAKKLVEEWTPRELQADEYDEDTECGYCRAPDPDCGCSASELLGDTILYKIDAKINELKGV